MEHLGTVPLSITATHEPTSSWTAPSRWTEGAPFPATCRALAEFFPQDVGGGSLFPGHMCCSVHVWETHTGM